MALEAEGRVRTYSDGAAALEALTEEPVDLASSTSRCRAWTAWLPAPLQTDMPVIFLTSRTGRSTSCSASSWRRRLYRQAVSQRLLVERQGDVAPFPPRFNKRRRGRAVWAGKLRIDPGATPAVGQPPRSADGDRVSDPVSARDAPRRGQVP
jgi:hypothetical protein